MFLLRDMSATAQEPTGRRLNGMADTGQLLDMIRYANKIQTEQQDSAKHMLINASEKSRASGFHYGVALSMFYLGNIYNKSGMFDSAVIALREALSAAVLSTRGKDRIPFIYGELSSVYLYQGLYEPALFYLFKALGAVHQQSPSLAVSGIYNNMGALLLYMPAIYQPDTNIQAIYYLDLAEKKAREEKQYKTLISVLINKGEYYARRKDWQHSTFYLNTALNTANMHQLVVMKHNALVSIAERYTALGKYEEAISKLQEAQSIRGAVSPSYRISAATHLAAAYIGLKKYAHAEELLLNALQEAAAQNLQANIVYINQVLATLYTELKNYRAALDYYRAYIGQRDSISGKEIAHTIQHLNLKYRTLQTDKELMGQQLVITRQEKELARKNVFITIVTSGIFIISVFLIFLVRNYRQRQRLQKERYENLQQKQEISKLKDIMKGEEQERTRLAQELHDGIGGTLAAINMNLDMIREDHPEIFTIPRLEKCLDMLHEAAKEVRKTAHNLMPDVLIKYNLVDALLIYCEQINSSGRLNLSLQTHGITTSINKQAQLILYRIVQELVQNVLKHANATHAVVQLLQTEDMLSITVEDDGSGFDISAHVDGIGFKNIRRRVEALKGYISVMSAPGRSTTVHIEFEIENLKLADR